MEPDAKPCSQVRHPASSTTLAIWCLLRRSTRRKLTTHATLTSSSLRKLWAGLQQPSRTCLAIGLSSINACLAAPALNKMDGGNLWRSPQVSFQARPPCKLHCQNNAMGSTSVVLWKARHLDLAVTLPTLRTTSLDLQPQLQLPSRPLILLSYGTMDLQSVSRRSSLDVLSSPRRLSKQLHRATFAQKPWTSKAWGPGGTTSEPRSQWSSHWGSLPFPMHCMPALQATKPGGSFYTATSSSWSWWTLAGRCAVDQMQQQCQEVSPPHCHWPGHQVWPHIKQLQSQVRNLEQSRRAFGTRTNSCVLWTASGWPWFVELGNFVVWWMRRETSLHELDWRWWTMRTTTAWWVNRSSLLPVAMCGMWMINAHSSRKVKCLSDMPAKPALRTTSHPTATTTAATTTTSSSSPLNGYVEGMPILRHTQVRRFHRASARVRISGSEICPWWLPTSSTESQSIADDPSISQCFCPQLLALMDSTSSSTITPLRLCSALKHSTYQHCQSIFAVRKKIWCSVFPVELFGDSHTSCLHPVGVPTFLPNAGSEVRQALS